MRNSQYEGTSLQQFGKSSRFVSQSEMYRRSHKGAKLKALLSSENGGESLLLNRL
jgi:hypothetical protein